MMNWFIRFFSPGPLPPTVPKREEKKPADPLAELEQDQRAMIKTLIERIETATTLEVEDPGFVTATWISWNEDNTAKKVVLDLLHGCVVLTLSEGTRVRRLEKQIFSIPGASKVRETLYAKSKNEICALALQVTEPR